MIAPPIYLRNWEPVVDAFGYWPSFHDANLSGFRSTSDGAGAIEFVVHGFEMTAEVDERGYFRLHKHFLVSFRFEGISDRALEHFLVENTLFELTCSPDVGADGFLVTLDSVMGGDCGGSFRARRGEVLAVTPCDSDGHVLTCEVRPLGCGAVGGLLPALRGSTACASPGFHHRWPATKAESDA